MKSIGQNGPTFLLPINKHDNKDCKYFGFDKGDKHDFVKPSISSHSKPRTSHRTRF